MHDLWNEIPIRISGSGDELQPELLINEDIVFDWSSFASLKEFSLSYRDHIFIEDPVCYSKRYDFTHKDSTSSGLTIKAMFCYAGQSVALEFLQGEPNLFQRAIPLDTARNITEEAQIGNFAVSWSWRESTSPSNLIFVYRNLLVSCYSQQDNVNLLGLGNEITTYLASLDTSEAYVTVEEGWLSNCHSDRPSIQVAERLDLGELDNDDQTHFFVSGGGSVNIEAGNSKLYYYRASLEPGDFQIKHYYTQRADSLFLKREILDLDILDKDNQPGEKQ